LRTVKAVQICAAAAAGLIHNIDRVAFAQEKLCPAFPAVGRPREIGPGLCSAVNENDRIGVTLMGWNLEFRIDLSAHYVRIFDG
jgi:hypothetical protein